MQFKSVRGNIAYAILLFTIVFIILYIELHFKKVASTEFEMMPHIIFLSIGYPIIGLVIGMPNLWKQFKEEGSWKVNVPRLLFLTLPLALLANFTFIVFSLDGLLDPILFPAMSILIMTPASTYIFQVLFGFALITSLYKGELQEQSAKEKETQTNKKESPTEGTL